MSKGIGSVQVLDKTSNLNDYIVYQVKSEFFLLNIHFRINYRFFQRGDQLPREPTPTRQHRKQKKPSCGSAHLPASLTKKLLTLLFSFEQGHGRGEIPFFSAGLQPLARVTLYTLDRDML